MTETQDKRTQDKSGTSKPVRLSDLAAKRAQNLRDNLARRKQQARARDSVEKQEDKN